MPFSAEMTKEAARFVTLTHVIPPSGGGFKRIIEGNSRRWYLYSMNPNAGGTNPRLIPAPAPEQVTGLQTAGAEQPYKFRDCPSIVTGEFYYFDDNLTTVWLIECVYMGE